MYIKGKKVKHISAIDAVYTMSDCFCCNSPGSYCLKVSFDSSWDDTQYIDVCSDCLIKDGWLIDYEDVKRVLGETIEDYKY